MNGWIVIKDLYALHNNNNWFDVILMYSCFLVYCILVRLALMNLFIHFMVFHSFFEENPIHHIRKTIRTNRNEEKKHIKSKLFSGSNDTNALDTLFVVIILIFPSFFLFIFFLFDFGLEI